MSKIELNISRDFVLLTNGKSQSGKLCLNSLELVEGQGKWVCRWSFDPLYTETVSFTGDDPLQALTRTLDFASSFIRECESDGIKLLWKVDGDQGGLTFPLCEEKGWLKEQNKN